MASHRSTRASRRAVPAPQGRAAQEAGHLQRADQGPPEKITRPSIGQTEKITVQQALLKGLRDQALLGELWAEKLVQKVIAAFPESGSEYKDIDMSHMSGVAARFLRLMNESARENAEAAQVPAEGDAVPDPVEPENDER